MSARKIIVNAWKHAKSRETTGLFFMTYITREIYDTLPTLRVGTAKTSIEITSEPFLKISSMGFLPCVRVKVIKSALEYTLVIGAQMWHL